MNTKRDKEEQRERWRVQRKKKRVRERVEKIKWVGEDEQDIK